MAELELGVEVCRHAAGGVAHQIGRLGGRGAHGLVEVDVLASQKRLAALLVVQPDRWGRMPRSAIAPAPTTPIRTMSVIDVTPLTQAAPNADTAISTTFLHNSGDTGKG